MRCVTAAFQDMQQSLERTSFNTEVSGSTCTLAHLTGQRLAVGWVGDSRAVLGRAQQDGSCLAVPLTQDHKPSDDRERARILAMQGRVERWMSLLIKAALLRSRGAFHASGHSSQPKLLRMFVCAAATLHGAVPSG